MSKIPKEKENKSDVKLKQTKMGVFLSKDSKKTSELKRKTENTSTSMWSSFWTRGAYRDTEEYRNRYPGKKDHPNWDDNYQFYMNHIPSKPDGDFIDSIHANWFGDYKRLEIHHGYIQWLFPIRDTGMNWHAQELQLHEIEKLTKSRKAKKRILMSFKMMLDFYGMQLKNESTGEIERADNWKERFKHLNRSYHNYLRITRILKSLGEFEFENLKANFVKFILYEGMVEYTLDNLIDSCLKYWIGVLRNDEERENVLDYYEELLEKQKEEGGKSKKRPKSTSPEPTIKVKTGPSRYINKFSSKSDSDEEVDMTQYDDMDLLADTLPFENDMDESDGEENNQNKSVEKPKKGNLRIVHDMSDSDTEDFKTPDVDESQEAVYWNRNKEAADDEMQIIKDTFESDMDAGDGKGTTTINKEETQHKDAGDTIDVLRGSREDKTIDEGICSDEVDDAISTREVRVSKIKAGDTDQSTSEESKSISEKTNTNNAIKEDNMDEMPEKNEGHENSKAAVDDHNDCEETPMETGDDGNVNV